MTENKIIYRKKLHVGKRQRYRRKAEQIRVLLYEGRNRDSNTSLQHKSQFSSIHNDVNLNDTNLNHAELNLNEFLDNATTRVNSDNPNSEEATMSSGIGLPIESNTNNISLQNSTFIDNESNLSCNSDLSSSLRYWATIKHNISMSALDDLLKKKIPFTPKFTFDIANFTGNSYCLPRRIT